MDHNHDRMGGVKSSWHCHGDSKEWQALMSDTGYPPKAGPFAAMNILDIDGFGTVSSSLIAIPRYPGFENRPHWLHAAGPPHEEPYHQVQLIT